ncbi:MAG: hypothetical protein U0794_06735 [Isosphaeraceae bacterium]
MPRLALALVAAALIAADGPLAFTPKPKIAADLPLVINEDFEHARTDHFEFTDRNAWKFTTTDGNTVADQFQASKYTPKVRSPFNFALFTKSDVTDFVLDLKVRSTARDYNHRDVCLIFGHQDPSHFYYVHLGKAADPHAHSIFLVNDQPRVSIAEDRTKGTPWTDGWHHVRLARNVGSGLIQVYFDDMDKPIMTAHDKTFTHGRIGLGTFDDTAQFDVVQVWGKRP